MFVGSCASDNANVTLMYDSRLLMAVRADLLKPGGETVEISIILKGTRIYRHFSVFESEKFQSLYLYSMLYGNVSTYKKYT